MTDSFTSRDLDAVKRRIKWSVTSRYLTPSDLDDIVGDVLLAAARTAPTDGVTIAAAAITNTSRPRYISRKVKDAEPYASSYRFGDASRVDGLSASEYDDAVLWSHGHAASASDAEATIRDLIARLPAGESRAFTLCGEFGYTLEQAASVLGISRSTVDRNFKRARATLQQALTH
ncbi:sigma-70 family RNA polymerase sigma factor [Microbacterium sp. ZXX196]|uniref:sigma-70 family RNA polymerase sigma factor n=1 Tax=Microbacterium sp. ZXX196 TaxID=2609291 RepID=UPI0018ACA75B|nr:sigma-70 family RNA polymerase sigma factor [Microbacterium sp. ZXX196]